MSEMPLTPEILLRAYGSGIFPMAEEADSTELFWVDPELRGIIPLDQPHIPKRLRRTIRQRIFEVRLNSDFEEVMRLCAEPADDRPRTWINRSIVELFTALHYAGYAHSVETWYEGEMVGGLYGLALNGAFFGESMFSRATDASKVALVYLMAHLVQSGFTLLDTQFITEHLRQFGAVEIPRAEYRKKLHAALKTRAYFQSGLTPDPVAVLQSNTHTS